MNSLSYFFPSQIHLLASVVTLSLNSCVIRILAPLYCASSQTMHDACMTARSVRVSRKMEKSCLLLHISITSALVLSSHAHCFVFENHQLFLHRAAAQRACKKIYLEGCPVQASRHVHYAEGGVHYAGAREYAVGYCAVLLLLPILLNLRNWHHVGLQEIHVLLFFLECVAVWHLGTLDKKIKKCFNFWKKCFICPPQKKNILSIYRRLALAFSPRRRPLKWIPMLFEHVRIRTQASRAGIVTYSTDKLLPPPCQFNFFDVAF